jgi:hypothetical protein
MGTPKCHADKSDVWADYVDKREHAEMQFALKYVF